MSLGTVLITGGSSGIGLGVATEVIKAGARVVIASSTQSKIDVAVADLNKLAGSSGDGKVRAFGYAIDLSNEHTMEDNIVALLKYASSPEVTGNSSGKITHIAHTAGDAHSVVPLKDWKPVGAFKNWTVRFLTAMTLAKHGPAYLEAGPRSSITFTTGTLGAKPIAGIASLIGPSSALEPVARSLAIELAPIRVNVVAPGAIDTPLLRGGAANSTGAVERWENDNLLGKIGTPEEAAQPYLYFMRDTFQTGMTLRNDGGRLLKSA